MNLYYKTRIYEVKNVQKKNALKRIIYTRITMQLKIKFSRTNTTFSLHYFSTTAVEKAVFENAERFSSKRQKQ